MFPEPAFPIFKWHPINRVFNRMRVVSCPACGLKHYISPNRKKKAFCRNCRAQVWPPMEEGVKDVGD